MKILLSSYHNPHFITLTEYIENAIKELGHELVIFDDRDHILPGRLRRKLKLLNSIDLNYINYGLSSLIQKTAPDLVIVAGGHRITQATLRKIKRQGISVVLWTTDPPIGWANPIKNVAAEYDHIFCLGSEMIDLLAEDGINNARLLPMACDPAHHYRVNLSEKEENIYGHDIVFVGSYYPIREKIFKHLKGYDLAIWGPGWDGSADDSELKHFVKAPHTKPSEWIKIYSSSKIILSVHYQNSNGGFPVHQANGRVFEAMACGGFVLSDDQRDVFNIFRDGCHLAKFSNSDELIEKVQYYLNHPGERRRIAEKGRQIVLSHHTYVHRIEAMLSITHPRLQEI